MVTDETPGHHGNYCILTWGCITRLDSGDTHKPRYLVIGLGAVWVNDSLPEAATISGVKSLGIAVSEI